MKRFTDTEIWEKIWFHDLNSAEKCAFMYIKDKCNNVGVWTPNFSAAEFFIKSKIDWDSFQKKCNGNIEILQNGKWWLIDFCKFQYKKLDKKTTSPPMQSYIKMLKEHNLWEKYLNTIDNQ